MQLQVGHFDNGFAIDHEKQQLVLSQHLPVAESTRQRLESKGVVERRVIGTSSRELHNSIFDAIVRGKGGNGTIFVGRGARTYDLVGKWIPNGIVGWMLRSKQTNPRSSASKVEDSADSSDSNMECKLCLCPLSLLRRLLQVAIDMSDSFVRHISCQHFCYFFYGCGG